MIMYQQMVGASIGFFQTLEKLKKKVDRGPKQNFGQNFLASKKWEY